MDFFWIIIFFIAIFFYFNKRISTSERRLDELEGRQGASKKAPIGRLATDEELASVGIHRGEIFERALVNSHGEITDSGTLVPPPALPAPMPMYASEAQSTPESPKQSFESNEETSARWLGRIGAIAVLIGVAFFLKYAFDNNWIGPTGRVALGIIFGLATIGVGQKLRAKYLNYSDMLMGVGIAILYLSIYASYSFYHLVDPSVAFVLMGLVTAFGLVLAIAGSTLGLAVLATLGGFMTPVLLSTGENHLMALSVYMIILDLGVFGVAWFKKWTQLNYISFIGTVVLFGGWIEKFYTHPQLGETFFFVTIFFAIFLITSILHHLLRKEATTPADLGLLVMNAALYFAVSTWLLDANYHDVLGFFALVLAVLYLGITYIAFTSNKSDRTLNLFLPGIAVVFLTIAIPLQLDGYYVTLSWLVEALVLTAIGLYLRERVIQVFGWIVLMVGTVSMGQDVENIRNGYTSGFHLLDTSGTTNLTPFWNMGFFLMMFTVLVFCLLASIYMKFKESSIEWKKAVSVIVVLANILTISSITSEIELKYDNEIRTLYTADAQAQHAYNTYNGNANSSYGNYGSGAPTLVADNSKINTLNSSKQTTVSIFWAVYAILLIAIGFAKRLRMIRLFGLVFFFVTAGRVFLEVWQLGQLERIISSIAFGVIALGASFLYVKYKDRLKEIVLSAE